jgi:hypothetical protein
VAFSGIYAKMKMGTGRELHGVVSVFFHMTFRRIALVALALALGTAGCAALPSVSDDILCSPDANCAIIQPDASADATFYDVGVGTEGGTPQQARASLCSGACSPDDAKSCLVDGGVGDAGYEACHVVLGVNQQTATACGKSGTGTEGASCTAGSDCAPGYECVGTGTCRRYCCDDNTCADLTASNQYDTFFCDVANEHASTGAVVPVCNAVVPCALFTDACPSNQACTIVEIDSTTQDAGATTSYIATCAGLGEAKIGASCETTHCGAGLACIGAVGSRTCQELCDSQHPCPTNLSCKMNSQALQKYKVGVCL